MSEEITQEDWEVVKHRIESMPAHLKLALGSFGALGRDEMINHINNRDEIGKKIVTMQINYLRFFRKEMEKIANE